MTDQRPAWAQRLQAERLSRGWGPFKVARKLFLQVDIANPSPAQVKNLALQVTRHEHGDHFPETWAPHYAAVYGIDEGELFGTRVPRREAIAAGFGAVGMALAVQPTSHLGHGRRIGMSTVDRLRERATRLRHLDDYLGGADTYRLYVAELKATRTLLTASTAGETVTRELLALAAEQAQQAGWAAFDAGWHGEARALYEDARTAAEDAGDSALAGNSLAYRAYQLTQTGRDATSVASAAHQAAADAPGRVRALLLERAAWVHAVAGEGAEVARLLGEAETALADDQGDAPHWAMWVDDIELQIMTGRCWAELHRPLRAVPALESAMSRYDDSHARDKALYLTWLATAYLDGNEVERACAALTRAMELATGVSSARPQQRVQALLGRFLPYRAVAEVAELLEKARAWVTSSTC